MPCIGLFSLGVKDSGGLIAMFCPIISVVMDMTGVGSCRVLRLLALLSIWDNKAVMGVRGIAGIPCIGMSHFLGVNAIVVLSSQTQSHYWIFIIGLYMNMQGALTSLQRFTQTTKLPTRPFNRYQE